MGEIFSLPSCKEACQRPGYDAFEVVISQEVNHLPAGASPDPVQLSATSLAIYKPNAESEQRPSEDIAKGQVDPSNGSTADRITTLRFSDGSYYMGEVKNGKRHGHGEWIFSEG